MNSNIDNLQLQNAILMDEDYEGEELLLNMGPARSETLLVEPIDEDIVTEDAHPVSAWHDKYDKYLLSSDRYSLMAMTW